MITGDRDAIGSIVGFNPNVESSSLSGPRSVYAVKMFERNKPRKRKMSKYETFAVEIPVNDPEAMDEFQKAMNAYWDEMNNLITEEADKLGIPYGAMSDIFYLRTRSRWTQEKEDYLIKLTREGKDFPNMMEDF